MLNAFCCPAAGVATSTPGMQTCCAGIFSLSTLFRSGAVDRARVAVSSPSIRVDEVRDARPRRTLRPLMIFWPQCVQDNNIPEWATKIGLFLLKCSLFHFGALC